MGKLINITTIGIIVLLLHVTALALQIKSLDFKKSKSRHLDGK